MRLKTKIVRRKDDSNFIYLIVLPSNHLLVERLIFENHTNPCYNGTQVVLSNLEQQCWILCGRKTVQRFLNQCIRFHQESNKAVSKEVRAGDVVLIGCDNKKRLDLPMRLVTEVFPEKDNSIRVVKVKNRMGELVRPVKRLYPLEQ
ncbi:hypothetical protein TNCV_3861191 [Trichonephila clavipes]|nr:hypothetical protein TNCV_3861191 [Trichonephila clavipes]